MVDNEYTPKEKDNLEKDNSKRKTNEAGNKKSQEKEIKSPSAKIKKIKTILGALLVLAAVFFFYSLYLLYFHLEDRSRCDSKHFFF